MKLSTGCQNIFRKYQSQNSNLTSCHATENLNEANLNRASTSYFPYVLGIFVGMAVHTVSFMSLGRVPFFYHFWLVCMIKHTID